jgi:N-ethylmaleimide reductase
MSDTDPRGLWDHVIGQLNSKKLAYLHLVEPGIAGSSSVARPADAINSAWVRRRLEHALIAAGEYVASTAEAAIASDTVDAVAFGRAFLANPDLPRRLRERAELTEYDRKTLYGGSDEGYIDYPELS